MKTAIKKQMKGNGSRTRDISPIVQTSYLTNENDVTSQFIDSMTIEIAAQNAFQSVQTQRETYEFFSALFVCVCIDSGTYEIISGSHRHMARPKDLLLFLPYQTYDIRLTAGKSVSFKYISFDVLPFTHKRRFQQMMLHCRQSILSLSEFDTYKVMFQELFNELEVRNIGHGCTLRLYLKQLIIEIFRNENLADVAGEYLQTHASADRIVNQSAVYMDAHLSDPIDIAAISRSLGISKTTLYNAFMEVMAISPIRFFTKYKMKLASLMLSRNMTMREIADQLGYSSVPHLSKTFKSVFGCSPSVWKAGHVNTDFETGNR